MRLAAITNVADGTKLFTFEPLNGKCLPAAAPGAHVDLHLPNDLVRQYSLVIAPPACQYNVRHLPASI